MRPLRILLAPGAFKETLSPSAAADAMEAGLRSVDPSIEIRRAPLADGGDGTLEAFHALRGGRFEVAVVTGPLGEPVRARFLMLENGNTAVIEMAESSGLRLVSPDRRNPWVTTTRGLGELIRAALDLGARKIIVGLGGSATVDGGAGMAQALGIRLLDAGGRDLPPGGGALAQLARIDPSGREPRLNGIEIVTLTDVRAPLLGPGGAARAFGPQKGADPAMVGRLEESLAHYAGVLDAHAGRPVRNLPGAGAAGGLGAGLASLLGAKLVAGAEVFILEAGLIPSIVWADAVMTGEGRFDATTLQGKAPGALLEMCGGSGTSGLVVCGSSDRPDAGAYPGTAAMATLLEDAGTPERAMRDAARYADRAAARALRRFLAVGGGPKPAIPLPPFVLASASTGRAELLRAWHYSTTLSPTGAPEATPSSSDDLRKVLLDNSRAKARTWLRQNPRYRLERGRLVAADTLTFCDGRIQGKAPDRAAALDVLRSVRGKPQQVLSAVWVVPLDRTDAGGAGGIAEATVRLRPELTDDDLRAYLATGKGDGKAGSFAIDPAGDPFFELLEGEIDTVIGLSRRVLDGLLGKFQA